MTAALRETLLARGELPLLISSEGETRSGTDLLARVERLAGALSENGLAGGCLGVWYENSLAAFEAYLAVEWVGATRVVLDPQAAAAEAAGVLAATGATALLADATRARDLGVATLCHDDETPLEGTPRGPLPDVPPARVLHLYPRAVRDDGLLAVPISYGNWAATIALNCRLYRTGRYGPWGGEDEVMLTLQQLLHGTGLMGSFPFLHMALPQVLARVYEPELAVELIGRHGVTTTGMTSGMLAVLLDSLPREGLPSLRRVLYGGAPFAPEQLQRALDLLGPSLVQVYGNLVGGWPLTILDPADHAALAAGESRLAGSCGRVADPAVELRVEADGELCTRSEMAVADYTDSHGWCRLGDRACIDDDGYVFLAGRLDSMVNTGYHVYPEEVQGALEELAGVAAARVVGEPDQRRGEVLAAYVVPRPDIDLDADTVRNALHERLAAYKVPRVIWIVDELDADQRTTPQEVHE